MCGCKGIVRYQNNNKTGTVLFKIIKHRQQGNGEWMVREERKVYRCLGGVDFGFCSFVERENV